MHFVNHNGLIRYILNIEIRSVPLEDVWTFHFFLQTTYFVSSAGKSVNKAVIEQRGKVAM